ncbi:MAG TPA: hypothetical protein VOA87_09410 [Thermoanaerobaculia bacterium]|nr:hypothetical protein [Thermoanaerobaculia bacterium]
MDLNASRIYLVRPYIFDYFVGVLWLVAAFIAMSTGDKILGFARLIDSMAASMNHATMPSFVVGFLIIIGGIIVPYCAALIIKLPTLLVMNNLLKIQRSWDKRRSKETESMYQLATSVIVRGTAGPKDQVSARVALLYLEMLQPSMAAALLGTREDIDFRASATVPTALIVGTAARRLLAPWLIASAAAEAGFILGVLSFIIAVFGANKLLGSTMRDISMAVLIADAHKAEKSARPSANPPERADG